MLKKVFNCVNEETLFKPDPYFPIKKLNVNTYFVNFK